MTQPHPAKSFALYGTTMWASPYVLSCFVALREKAVPFEVRNLALNEGAHHDPAFATLSLTSRVPVLVDAGFELSESNAIVEYLEERLPAPEFPRVLPSGIRDRARARQVMAWLRSDLAALREERSSEYVFWPHSSLAPLASLSDAGRRATDKLLSVAERLVPDAGGPLFGAWCVADTDLAMMLQRLVKTGHELPSKLTTFASTQWMRPAVQEFVQQHRPAYSKPRKT